MEKVWKKVVSSKTLTRILKSVDIFAVIFTVTAYAITLLFMFLAEKYLLSVKLALVCFVPFVIVTLVRRFVNAPRPYELYDFFEKPPKSSLGRSFPSRHAFSAFAIGTALCYVGLPLGIICLVLGLCLGACRVFLGIHFPRDVIAGAIIGTLSSVIGMLIVNF